MLAEQGQDLPLSVLSVDFYSDWPRKSHSVLVRVQESLCWDILCEEQVMNWPLLLYSCLDTTGRCQLYAHAPSILTTAPPGYFKIKASNRITLFTYVCCSLAVNLDCCDLYIHYSLKVRDIQHSGKMYRKLKKFMLQWYIYHESMVFK